MSVTVPAPTGAAALTDGEAETLLHRDRRDQLIVSEVLSPGMTISAPSAATRAR
jgi:hypothetical protein